MENINNYLYFPECKITRAEYLPGYPTQHFILTIKSLQKTPSHYPKHFTLEGKADFMIKFHISSIDSFKTDFNKIFSKGFKKKNDLKNTIGSKVSVIAKFNLDSNIKLCCLGFGLPFEKPTVFNNNEDYTNAVDAAHLNHSLIPQTSKKTKKQKI